ncbi:glycosyl hydrolase family 28-related protein [Streptomyces sp. NPDC127072]|uniref:glycosyl hydrolase family 28-related protein n=1 Tax=Streptomyces sp. NPDC127072 TaxID=3347129 RepID=UPI00364BD081
MTATPAQTAGAEKGPAQYRAVDARTNGTRVDASGPQARLVDESVARAVVRLSGPDEYVEFHLVAPADALTLRYSLPDAPTGGGRTERLLLHIDGEESHRLTLSSRHSWYYGAYPFTNDPAAGRAHHLYDDVHVLLGRTCPPGTRVTLRLAAEAEVPVTVDIACFEETGGPASPPRDALSVLDFGADPTGTADSTSAVRAAVEAATGTERAVWLPRGVYTVTDHIVLDRVTIRGAGPWYTELRGTGVGLYGHPAPRPSTGVHVSGLAIFGDVTERDDSAQHNGIGGALGGGSTIEDVWIAHTKCGMWLDGPFEDLTIRNVRIMNTTADGINLHRGVSDVTITGCHIHNTGDDAIALWSDGLATHHNTVHANTIVLPMLANHIAVYGGHDNRITGNLLADSVAEGGGIHIANRYGAVPVAGKTLVEGNSLIRTGSYHPRYRTGVGALWLLADDAPMTGDVTVRENILTNSAYAAVQLSGDRIDGVDVDGMAIEGAGTCAVQLEATGSARFTHVTAVGLGVTGLHRAAPGFDLLRGAGNEGWDEELPELPPDGALYASVTRLDLGAVTPLTASAPQRLELHNPGPRQVLVQQVELTGDFTAASPTPATIAPGATAVFTLGFTPSRTGRCTGVLTVHSDAPRSPLHVDLAGVGFDPAGDRALGRRVKASTAMGGFPPESTVDGTERTWWQSDGMGFPQWLQVDLGEPVSLARIVLRTPQSWDGRTETLAVHTGLAETDLAPATPAVPCRFVPERRNTVVLPLTRTARFVRLQVTDNTAWAGAALSAFEVYAADIG